MDENHKTVYIKGLINESDKLKKDYDYEKSYEKAKIALNESRKIDYKKGIIMCQQILSHIRFYRGNYSEVLEYEQEIVNYAVEKNNKDLLATHYIALSALYIQLDEIDQAEKLIHKARAIANELQNQVLMIKVYMNLG